MRNDFAIFILSHGRPDNVVTVETLERCGYTGKYYIVIDNEDDTAERYYEKFGKDKVIMFDKLKKSKEFDTVDNGKDRRAIVYARNACFDIAEDLGLTYFLELDDDYDNFRSRYEVGTKLATCYVRDLDSIIDCMLEFLEETNAITVAFAQTGDFIGGIESRQWRTKLSRKAMNSFFCKTDRRFDFIGRINEDVNTYVNLGAQGKLLFTIREMSLDQCATQINKGGMTELYLNAGTYFKSFFSVVTNPSSVTVFEMGAQHKRIHHLIDWPSAVPMIVSSRFKKEVSYE